MWKWLKVKLNWKLTEAKLYRDHWIPGLIQKKKFDILTSESSIKLNQDKFDRWYLIDMTRCYSCFLKNIFIGVKIQIIRAKVSNLFCKIY